MLSFQEKENKNKNLIIDQSLNFYSFIFIFLLERKEIQRINRTFHFQIPRLSISNLPIDSFK